MGERMYWRLEADDPGFHLAKGDIVEGSPVLDDPGSASNPEGSFGGRPMKWAEAEQWQYELDLLRRQLHVQEFTLEGVEKARREAT